MRHNKPALSEAKSRSDAESPVKLKSEACDGSSASDGSSKALLGSARYGLSEARHRSWGLALHMHAQSTARVERRLEAEGALPLDWYDLLLALEKAPGGQLRMGELGEHVTLSRSGLTRLVDRIEAAGLVERQLCPGDRRGFEATLTDTGRQAREKCWPILARIIAQEFGNRYSDEEAEQLSALLERQLDPGGNKR